MNISTDQFSTTKQKAEEEYKAINEVYCPFLQEKVAFNAKGLDHIKFKKFDKARSLQDQYIRLRLISVAPRIIKESHTLQEYFETMKEERQKINSRWERRIVKVKYYGFVAIINRHRLKVIVKEIEGGGKFFWSLIPFWKSHRNKITHETKKVFHEGDLEVE